MATPHQTQTKKTVKPANGYQPDLTNLKSLTDFFQETYSIPPAVFIGFVGLGGVLVFGIIAVILAAIFGGLFI